VSKLKGKVADGGSRLGEGSCLSRGVQPWSSAFLLGSASPRAPSFSWTSVGVRGALPWRVSSPRKTASQEAVERCWLLMNGERVFSAPSLGRSCVGPSGSAAAAVWAWNQFQLLCHEQISVGSSHNLPA